MVAHRSRDRALYLLGEVSDVDGDSNLRGSFAFHPFNIVMALIPFVIAALVWTWGSRTVWEMIFIAAIFAAELIVVLSVRRARAREEHEIVDFILGLFPNARQHRRRFLAHRCPSVCNLLILWCLENRRETIIAAQDRTHRQDVLSTAREASAAWAATFKRGYRKSAPWRSTSPIRPTSCRWPWLYSCQFALYF